MQVKEIPWGGWQRCLQVCSDQVELVVTLDVGPRIIYCALTGHENILGVMQDDLGRTGDTEWRFYGGHRLWHAPEDPQRTYQADNSEVQWSQQNDGFICLKTPPEPLTGLSKTIFLAVQGNKVFLKHEITNHSVWNIEAAPWALTVLAEGAQALVPDEPYIAHGEALLPARPVVLWPYSKLNDSRISYESEGMLIQQNVKMSQALKLGFLNTPAWLGAKVSGQWMSKHFEYNASACYPDFNSNCEVYTDDKILELESLGELQSCPPQGKLSFKEIWQLHATEDAWRRDSVTVNVDDHFLNSLS